VFLLLTLAATSIVGTLIPQNEDPAAYVQAYGDFVFRLFSTLGIFDMYHSWWFQSLLLLLTANIVVCSIDRLSATRNILFVKNPSFNVSKFRGLKNKETFDDDRSPEQLRKLYLPYFERVFRHSHLENTDKGFCLFGEKGCWTRLGVYTVHLSVILLLVGGLIGSIFGFDGFVNIPEGEAVTSDPGVWLVCMGFIVMIIGCYITFFMSHQQFCVEVVEKSNYSRIIVSGKANKNKLGVHFSIFGFGAVLVTYFGVNYLPGLHSYGSV